MKRILYYYLFKGGEMKFSIKRFLPTLIASLVFLGSGKIALAQITGGQIQRIGSVPISTRGIFELLAQVINILLLIAGVIAFLFLLWGGFQYLTAGSNEDQATSGRKIIINAIIGIVIIFFSYSLVHFVINQLGSGAGGGNVQTIPGLQQGG